MQIAYDYSDNTPSVAPPHSKAGSLRASATAIVPSDKKDPRTCDVLEDLCCCEVLADIILIDYRTIGHSSETVPLRDGVHYVMLTNAKGKAHAMDVGVRMSNTDILFFCDADLKGLTPDIVTQIIRPVANGEVDMFIGVRKDWMHKTVTLFALNSAERALRKELWWKLPDTFRHHYRIEMGLNYYSRYEGIGFGWNAFSHYRPQEVALKSL